MFAIVVDALSVNTVKAFGRIATEVMRIVSAIGMAYTIREVEGAVVRPIPVIERTVAIVVIAVISDGARTRTRTRTAVAVVAFSAT